MKWIHPVHKQFAECKVFWEIDITSGPLYNYCQILVDFFQIYSIISRTSACIFYTTI